MDVKNMKYSYTLENTDDITIAELISKLKQLPQEDFCDDSYLDLYRLEKEDPILELEKSVKFHESELDRFERAVINHKEKLFYIREELDILKQLKSNEQQQ